MAAKKKEVKESREKRSTVASEMLEKTKNQPYEMDYVSPLHIPDSVKKPGFDYKFFLDDKWKLQEAERKYWTFVPKDRLPYRERQSVVLENNNPLDKFISHKDLILAERPEEYGIIDRQRLHAKNHRQIASLSGVQNDAHPGSNNYSSARIDSF